MDDLPKNYPRYLTFVYNHVEKVKQYKIRERAIIENLLWF